MNDTNFTMEEKFLFEKLKRDMEKLDRDQAIAMCIQMVKHMIFQDKVHKKVMRLK